MELENLFKKYSSDKHCNGYHKIYENLFAVIKNDNINILEIGVLFGHSLLAWKDYFPNGIIHGADIFFPSRYEGKMKSFGYDTFISSEIMKSNYENNHTNLYYYEKIKKYIGNPDKIKLYMCSQTHIKNGEQISRDPWDIVEGLQTITDKQSEFDIILDDGSHRQEDQQITLGYLFKFLNSGGFYVIEDIKMTRHNIYIIEHFKKTSLLTFDLLTNLSNNMNISSPYISIDDAKYITDNTEWCKAYECEKNSAIFVIKKNKIISK